MVQFVAWTGGGEFQPQLMKLFNVFRPETRRMGTEVDKGGLALGFVRYHFQGDGWPRFRQLFPLDADGVALAAIQGLNQKVEEREASLRRVLDRRAAENAELKKELRAIRDLLQQLTAKRD